MSKDTQTSASPAPSYLLLLSRFVLDPTDVAVRLRTTRPVAKSVAASAVATLLYAGVLDGTLADTAAVVRLAAFDRGTVAIFLDHLLFLAPATALALLVVALGYVPVALWMLGLLGGRTRNRGVVAENFEGLAAAALTAWTATLAVWTVPALVFVDPYIGRSLLVWIVLPGFYFVGLMALVLAGVDDAGVGRGAAASTFAGLALVALPLAPFLVGSTRSAVLVLAMILVLRLVYLSWSTARRGREQLRRRLEAATLNPADAGAHVDLGAYYEKRGEPELAYEHYRRAVEVDPSDPAAAYRLGCIERARGDLAAAIGWFDAVIQVDENYASSEVWREVAETYFTAGQYDDAKGSFERFLAARPSDAEGRYFYALTLEALGEEDRARENMRTLVEAYNAGPIYKQRLEGDWHARAERFLKGGSGRP